MFGAYSYREMIAEVCHVAHQKDFPVFDNLSSEIGDFQNDNDLNDSLQKSYKRILQLLKCLPVKVVSTETVIF